MEVLKRISSTSDFLHIFSWFDKCILVSRRSGADNPRGQNFDARETSCHFGHLLQVSKNLFDFWFYTIFFMVLYIYIALGQRLTTLKGWNFDVNRNILSLQLFCCKFQKNLFEVWFYTNFFMILYMYIAPGQGQTAPRDKILMSTEKPYHFSHLLQVSKKSLCSLILYNFFFMI